MAPEIAVIDSGVNLHHPHVGNILGGHGLEEGNDGRIIKTDGFLDEIGHGTAICGIIHHKSPFAKIYTLKIFTTQLSASIFQLTAALKWCIGRRFNIIHLSLGVEDAACAEELHRLCQLAAKENIIILASAKGPYCQMYPACFDSVIGVYGDPKCQWGRIRVHPESKIEFGAHPHPRPIPGLPQEHNLKGHSFAVAHITAEVAWLIKAFPDRDPAWIKEELVQQQMHKSFQ